MSPLGSSLTPTRSDCRSPVAPCQASRVPCYPFFMLSPSDVAFYREQGYLMVPDVLDAATLDSVRRELARILDGARAVTAHTDVYDLEPGHRPDDPRVRRVKTPHRFFPVFDRLMRHPRLVAILTSLLGDASACTGPRSTSSRRATARRWSGTRTGRSTRTPTTTCSRSGSCSTTAPATTARSLVVPGTHRGPTFDHHADGTSSAGPSIRPRSATRSRGRCRSPGAPAP